MQRPIAMVAEFLRLESTAGVLLMAAAALALVLANSPAAPAYVAALEWKIGLGGARLSLLHWVNDGLMAVFFLLIGLEIKRELLIGELSSVRKAALPAVAALGGMIVPALIFVAFNRNDPLALRGWAVPAATDIAFALGVLALLRDRIPLSLKVLLTAIAVLDDLGAILIIAVFYTVELSVTALVLALAGVALLLLMNRLGVTRLAVYLVGGVAVWVAVLASGVHATLAGVAVAFCIPLRVAGASDARSPLLEFEHRLHPWVAYGVLPIFALANAGLSLTGLSPGALMSPIPLGTAAGLFVGKQLGVMLAAGGAVRLGWAQWPTGASLAQVYGIAVLCGIGFTMSLFIGGLAFDASDLQAQVKLGVFAGSPHPHSALLHHQPPPPAPAPKARPARLSLPPLSLPPPPRPPPVLPPPSPLPPPPRTAPAPPPCPPPPPHPPPPGRSPPEQWPLFVLGRARPSRPPLSPDAAPAPGGPFPPPGSATLPRPPPTPPSAPSRSAPPARRPRRPPPSLPLRPVDVPYACPRGAPSPPPFFLDSAE